MIARQYQNSLIGFRKTRQLIQQRIQLAFIQQRHRFFVTNRQAVKRFCKLMRVLLNKTVGYLSNTAIEAVSGIQIAAIALAKGVMEGSS
ncbi:hypothetical protein D3C73_1035700 [compost metagenome]